MYQGTVGFLVAEGYADAEFRLPYDRIGRIDTYDVVVLGLDEGVRVPGREGTEAVEIERAIHEVRPEDFLALVIPGGDGVDRLRADPRVLDWVRRFDATDRMIAAIGEGSVLLVDAGLVRNRSVAAWPVDAPRIEAAGGHAVDEPVVEDGAWITSRHAGDADAFTLALVQALRHREISAVGEEEDWEPRPGL